MIKLDVILIMLKELIDVCGIVGNECELCEVMKKYIELFVDEFFIDNLGSLVVKKVGEENGLKIMVVGYLDEVGFMII